MVSHRFWVEQLGETPDLSGQRLILNDRDHAIVGVLPAGFQVPGFPLPPILTPLTFDVDHIGYWSNHNAVVFGRLAPDAQLEVAALELSAVASRLEELHPEWNEGIGATLVPAREQLVQGARQNILLLFGATGLVLLIACANIASLFLARAAAFERETAVRMALGARGFHIIRLVLSEALIVSAAGGLLGMWLGFVGVDLVRTYGPSSLPRLAEVVVSLPVLLFTLTCTLGTALLIGLAPALRSSRLDIQTTLNKSGRSPGLGPQHRTQRMLVMTQVAVAVVLLTSSGLLLRTLGNLLDVDSGFESEGRVAMHITLPEARYREHAQITSFLDRLHDRLDAIPGVEASGTSVGLPFQTLQWRKYMTLEAHSAPRLSEVPVVDVSISTPGYVEALGIPLIRGRPLLESDRPETGFVALVNEAFVREHLPTGETIGRRLRLAPPDALLADDQVGEVPWYTIVGVVGDVRRWSLTGDPLPEVFIPQGQDTDIAREFFVVAHTSLPIAGLGAAMREAVWQVDPGQPVAWVQPISSMFSAAVSQPRFNAMLVAAFAVAALTLAVIGIYGLMANAASARTTEIGVRIALGARTSRILRDVASQGILAALGGMVFGLAASVGVGRLMGSMLFEVEPFDVLTYFVAAGFAMAAAVVAATVPTWRAARLDPTTALRGE
jgi:putative ABC transport system permease protein